MHLAKPEQEIFFFYVLFNGGNMNEDIYGNLVTSNSAFSVATLLYTRLRRVSGRVIDAMYLSSNPEYAKHVIDLAIGTKDADLIKHAENLKQILGIEDELIEEEFKEELEENFEMVQEQQEEDLMPSYVATEDEVYKAQVSHHYIGSLR